MVKIILVIVVTGIFALAVIAIGFLWLLSGSLGVTVDREAKMMNCYDCELDTREWHQRLAHFTTRSFYVDERGLHDMRDLFDAYKDRHGTWIAKAEIAGRWHKITIGTADQVTTNQLFEVLTQFDELGKAYVADFHKSIGIESRGPNQ